jgi:hypothetical protein
MELWQFLLKAKWGNIHHSFWSRIEDANHFPAFELPCGLQLSFDGLRHECELPLFWDLVVQRGE